MKTAKTTGQYPTVECMDCEFEGQYSDLINKTGKHSKDEIVCCPKCGSKHTKDIDPGLITQNDTCNCTVSYAKAAKNGRCSLCGGVINLNG